MAEEPTSSESGKESLFKKIFPYFLRFLRLLVVLALLLDGCACGLVAKGSVDSNSLDNQGRAFGVLAQAGFMVIVLLLIFAEFGFQWFIRVFYLFHFWTGRGLSLGWLGIQAINSVEQLQTVMSTTQSTIDPNAVNIVGNVVGWTLISCGFLYVVMSFLCLQSMTGAKSLEDLESGLLGGTSEPHSPPPAPGRDKERPLTADTVHTDDEDAQLLINAAEALGFMNVRELRSKFGGRDGRRGAIAHYQNLQKQAEEITVLRGEVKKLQTAGDRKSFAHVAKGDKNQQQQQSVSSPTVPASATAPPPSTTNRGRDDDDDDDPRSRRMRDDEDLESQYYRSQGGL